MYKTKCSVFHVVIWSFVNRFSPHRGLIIHVSAENCKFLQIADELELMKATRSGVMKNFNISCLDDFFIDDSMAIDSVLTLAERQMLIKHAIDNIKATEIEKFIPGYEHLLLYHGQSLINACMVEGLIANMLSLRDTVEFSLILSLTMEFSLKPIQFFRNI